MSNNPEVSFPGRTRFLELYNTGVSYNRMANDPILMQTFLAGIDNERSRAWKIYYKVSELAEKGILLRRKKSSKVGVSLDTQVKTHGEVVTVEQESLFKKHLASYEKVIGASSVRRINNTSRSLRGYYEAVVFSDPHVPDERMDLIAEICSRHSGVKDCYIAGDINDFEAQGRYLKRSWDQDNLISALAKTEAMLSFVSDHFPNVYLLLGNHDMRLANNASRVLGPDYYWMSQEFLLRAYEVRYGVKVVRNRVVKENGRELDMYNYTQVGDCVIGHIEVSGKPVGKGSEKANAFYNTWKRHLKLEPFNVVLQAHTHKRSYFQEPITEVHCFEIGCVCDQPDYALYEPKYNPVQHGYYHLIQYDGITDINESRLYCLE